MSEMSESLLRVRPGPHPWYTFERASLCHLGDSRLGVKTGHALLCKYMITVFSHEMNTYRSIQWRHYGGYHPGRQLRVSPLFFPEKTDDLFLLITVTFIDFTRVSPPWTVSPRNFFYLVCPLFFINLPTFFSFGCHPWRVSPGAVSPQWRYCIGQNGCRAVCVVRRVMFLPRCMECSRGIAMGILSVCPSVCPSNACIVTKRKKAMFRFLYHMKGHWS